MVHRGIPELCSANVRTEKAKHVPSHFLIFIVFSCHPGQIQGRKDTLCEKITQTEVQKTVEKAIFEKFNQAIVRVL